MTQTELLNISEAAIFLGKCSKTIRRYVKSGKLNSQKIGKALFFKKEDLELIKNSPSNLTKPENSIKVAPKDDKTSLDSSDLKENNYIPSYDKEIPSDIITCLDKLNERIDYISTSYKKNNNFEVEKLLEENKKLKNELELIKSKNEMNKDKTILFEKEKEIENLKSIIESNKKGILLLKDEINLKNEIIKRKDEEISMLNQKIEQLKMSVDSLELEIKKTQNPKSLKEIFSCSFGKRRK